MRKQTKIAAVASAAALLAIGASMTSFAAGWTTNADGVSTYVNGKGEVVPGFHRDPSLGDNKEYFVSEETKTLVKHAIVEYDGELYYVDGHGAKAKNRWIPMPNTDEVELYNGEVPETLWYYVGAKGKITVGEPGTLVSVPVADGSSTKGNFMFDEEGHMLTGWYQDADGNWIFCDPEGDVSGVVGMAVANKFVDLNTLDITDDDVLELTEDDPDDDGAVWIYFKKNGVSQGQTGPTQLKDYDKLWYSFDENGILIQDSWVDGEGNAVEEDDPKGVYYAKENGDIYSARKWHYIYNDAAEKVCSYYMDKNLKAVGKGSADTYTAVWINKAYYLFDNQGRNVADTVVNLNGDKVTLGTDNDVDKMAKDNKMFYVDADGKLVVGAKAKDGFADNKGGMVVDEVAIINNVVYVNKVSNRASNGAAANKDDKAYSVAVGPAYEDYAYIDVDPAKITVYSKKGVKTVYEKADDNPYVKAAQDGTALVENGKVRLIIKSNGTLAKSKKDISAEWIYNDGAIETELSTDGNGLVKAPEETK